MYLCCWFFLSRGQPTCPRLFAKIRFCPINSMRIHDRIPSVLGDTYPADWLFTNAVFSTLKRCRIACGARLGRPSLGKQQAGKRSPDHTISREARTERIQSLTRDLRKEMPPVRGVPYQKGPGNVNATGGSVSVGKDWLACPRRVARSVVRRRFPPHSGPLPLGERENSPVPSPLRGGGLGRGGGWCEEEI